MITITTMYNLSVIIQLFQIIKTLSIFTYYFVFIGYFSPILIFTRVCCYTLFFSNKIQSHVRSSKKFTKYLFIIYYVHLRCYNIVEINIVLIAHFTSFKSWLLLHNFFFFLNSKLVLHIIVYFIH